MTRRLAPAILAVVAILAVAVVLARQAAAERTATGVVVDVDARSLADVRAFTIREGDGRHVTFRIEQLENPTEFPPAHLTEHLSTSEPVRVFFRESEGERVAFRIEDAPG